MKEHFTWPEGYIRSRLPLVPFGQDEKDKQTRHHPTRHLHLVHYQQASLVLVHVLNKISGLRNFKFNTGRCQPCGMFVS